MKANQTPRLRRDERAVSEIVGSVLLVSITVIMAAALGLTVFALTKPVDPMHADVTLFVKAGSNGWGDGDETISMKHLGGETLEQGQIAVRYTIAGTAQTVSGAALATVDVATPGVFADGNFNIGETWIFELTIDPGVDVDVDVIVDTPGGATQLLATVEATTECGTDTAPPIVQVWERLSATTLTTINIDSDTTGNVKITALVTDFCSGVNPAVSPLFNYKIDTFTDSGNIMAPTGTTNQWTYTILESDLPSGDWGASAGKNLEYWLSNLEDLATPTANNGDSNTETELIDDANDFTYPTAPTFTSGSFPNNDFSEMLTGDEGATTQFVMASSTGTATTTRLDAMTFTDSSRYDPSNHWTNDAAVATLNEGGTAYASTTQNTPDAIRVNIADTSLSGTISKITVAAQVAINGYAATQPDSFQIKACNGSSTTSCTSAVSTHPTNLASEVDFTFDLTTDWDAVAWDWSDINAIEISIDPVKDGSKDGEWRVDSAWITVSYTPLTYTADALFDFPAVPALPAHELHIDYSVSRSGAFEMEIGDGTTTLPVIAMDDLVETTMAISLAALDEQNLRVRIYNANAPGVETAAATMNIDYMRVVSE